MKKIAFVCFLLCCLFLYSEEEIVVIDSALADYDGKKITLSGNVVVEHKLGTISADQVILTETPQLVKNLYGMIHMQGNVCVALKEGGKITCAQADVDYNKRSAVFSGTPEQESVVYTESLHSQGEMGIALVVKGRRMSMQLLKRNPGDSPKNAIESISIEESVTVNYNHDLIAFADSAHYQHEEGSENQRLPGTIVLKAAKQGGGCQLTNRQGDVVRSNEMQIDTLKRYLTFASPRGSIEAEFGRMEFTADSLLWDEHNQALTLEGNVEVVQQDTGTIKTPHQIRIEHVVENGHKQPHIIYSPSQTHLTYRDQTNHPRTIFCPGPVQIDHQKKQGTLTGILDQQIAFEDSRGEIFADKAFLVYQGSGKGIVPEKIFLEGNVRILNHLTPDNQKTTAALHYVLADELEYTPANEEMLFKSNGARRVLFFDKVNNMQVSAPGLKLYRDQISGKDSIQGIGDVRFSFVELEFEQLKQKFSLLQSSQG